jgi:hypothetical protein
MTVWSSLNAKEIGTLQDLRDSCDSGYFLQKQAFSGSPKAVQKDEVNAYVYFTAFASYNAKSLNQLIAKEDIGAYGGGDPTPAPPGPTPPPPTAAPPTLYYLVQQSNCVDNGTTTTATLGAQVSAPIVGQFVTLSNTGGGYPGCWRVTSIGTGPGATSIIANFGSGEGACYCNVAPTTPVIVLGGTLSGPTVCIGATGNPQTFTVSGTNLVANVVITPPSGYEVSTYNGGYASSVSLSPSVGTLSNTTIYVRLKNNANNGDGGLINVTSTNAVTQTINTGTATVNILPTITSTTNNSRAGTGTVTLLAEASSGAVVDWYSNSDGTGLIALGTNSYTTYTLTTTTTFYVKARNPSTGCISSGVSSVVATINADNNFKSAIIDVLYISGHINTYRLELSKAPFVNIDVIASTTSSDRHFPTNATTAPDSYLIAAKGVTVASDVTLFQRFGINLKQILDVYGTSIDSRFTFVLWGTKINAHTDYTSVDYSIRVNSLIDAPDTGTNVDFRAEPNSLDEFPATQSSPITAGVGVEQQLGSFIWHYVNNTFTYTPYTPI